MGVTSATSKPLAVFHGHLRQPGRTRACGFTLIELLVVVAIVVLLSTALPLALDRSLPGRRVALTAQKLVSAVRDAGSQSMSIGQPVDLELSESGLAGGRGIAVTFASTTQVTLVDADGRPLRRLRMYPDGSADSGRFLVRERSHARSVTVSAHTGRVTLEASVNAT
jgi:general secretion pathway protein H